MMLGGYEMSKIGDRLRHRIVMALAFVFMLGVLPLLHAQVVQADPNRLFLEGGIEGRNVYNAVGLRLSRSPRGGSMSMGVYSDGVRVGTYAHIHGFQVSGMNNLALVYDIADLGVTRLTGTFGRVGHSSRSVGELSITCVDSGVVLAFHHINDDVGTVEVDIPIPPTVRSVRIGINVNTVMMWFGFGSAYFTIDPNFVPVEHSIDVFAGTGGTVTGGGSFRNNAAVSLRATANAGFTFAGWYEWGTRVSTANPWNFNAAASRTLEARFNAQVQNVRITANAGSGGTATGGGTVASGTSVTLRATPNNNFVFDGWFEGNTRVSTANPWTFNATADRTVQARFVQAGNNITITATAGAGGTATGGGTVASGTSVTLRATPNNNFVFDGWFEGNTRVSTANPWTFNATANRTLQARFTQQAQQVTIGTITRHVGTEDWGTITVTPGESRLLDNGWTRTTVASGTRVTLTATPRAGYTFTGWYRDNRNAGGQITRVTTNQTHSFNATEQHVDFMAAFARATEVTITANAGTGGTATGGGRVSSGASVTLRATANNNFTFIGWYEGNTRVSTSNPWTFNATANRTLQARFTGQRVTVTANAGTGGTATGGGTVDAGASVTLRATANSGFVFDGWFEGGVRVSSANPWTFNANANRTLQARFVMQPTGEIPPGGGNGPAPPVTGDYVDNPHSPWAGPELQRAREQNLIPTSLQDPHVDLRQPITRAEFAGVVVMAFENLSNSTALPVIVNRFDDTADPYVLRAYNIGLMVGVSDTQFDPHTPLNREQTATALTRSFKRATIPTWTFATDANYPLNFPWQPPFADDANISDWARESVYFMAANGIIQGTGNNMFSPRAATTAQQAAGYATATREQALVIALRMIENLR